MRPMTPFTSTSKKAKLIHGARIQKWLLLRSEVPTGKGRVGDFMGTGDALYGAVPVSH